MPSNVRRVLSRVVLTASLLSLAAACSEAPAVGSLQLELLSPPGDNPLLGAAFVRLQIDDRPAETWPVQPLQPIDVGLHVDADGRAHQLGLEGLDADGSVTSRGLSAPVVFTPGADVVLSIVARPVGRFSLTRMPLWTPRVDFALVSTPDTVWAIGGTVGVEATAGTERIDPWLTEVEPGPELPEARTGPVAAVGSDGTVLVLGDQPSILALAPGSETWTSVGTAQLGARGAIVSTGDDTWLAIDASQTFEVTWNGELAGVQPGPSLSHPRERPVAVRAGDAVLVLGGTETLGEWLGGPSLSRAAESGAAALALGPTVLVVAGASILEARPDGTISEHGPLSEPRAHASIDILVDGRVIVAGGADAAAGTADILGLDAEGWRVVQSVSLTTGRMRHRSARLPDGTVMLMGGLGLTGGFVSLGDVFVP
ncbi:MAG: hypothetical protein ACI9WU_002253 [Myxococcota bacterium]|jgi:hypothetical protein